MIDCSPARTMRAPFLYVLNSFFYFLFLRGELKYKPSQPCCGPSPSRKRSLVLYQFSYTKLHLPLAPFDVVKRILRKYIFHITKIYGYCMRIMWLVIL